MELVSSNENTNLIIFNKRRTSNIELLRIILMIFIIAHHYVVNSGVIQVINESKSFDIKNILALCGGGYGKIAINIFVLITGYFMCKGSFKISKWIKLFLEVLFYNLVIYFIFLGFGYESFDVISFTKKIFIFYNLSDGFSSAFIIFYLFIPFLNVLVKNLDKKKHLLLIALLILIFSLLPSFPKINVTLGYIGWFMVLYCIASYIRIYPNNLFDNFKITLFFCLIMIFTSLSSIIACYAIRCFKDIDIGPYFFVSDCNKIVALLTAISIFLLVKNINISYNVVVNTISRGTFGVLLIHANSSAMRKWLWIDLLDNVGHFATNDFYWHFISCVLGIYIICVCIDLLRVYCIETPIIKWINKKKENKKEIES